MGKMGSVFDGDFYFISFSQNKPGGTRWTPQQFSTLSDNGKRRACYEIPKEECATGRECFDDPDACECYGSAQTPRGRCINGGWCVQGCDGCCNEGTRYEHLLDGGASGYRQFTPGRNCPRQEFLESQTENTVPTEKCDCATDCAPAFCCPKGTPYLDASNALVDNENGECIDAFSIEDYTKEDGSVVKVCKPKDCDCVGDVYSAMSDICKDFCCSLGGLPASQGGQRPDDCPICVDKGSCDLPRSWDNPIDCNCVCPGGDQCQGGKEKNQNCECTCPGNKVWACGNECKDACEGNKKFAIRDSKCECVDGCAEDEFECEGTCYKKIGSCVPQMQWKRFPPDCECRDCEEIKNGSCNCPGYVVCNKTNKCIEEPECNGQKSYDKDTCECEWQPCVDQQGAKLKCKERNANGVCVDKVCDNGAMCDPATGECNKCSPCRIYDGATKKCGDIARPQGCSAPLGVPVEQGDACKCFCISTGQEKPADGDCPANGQQGPVAPGGNGGDGGDGGDGGSGDGGGDTTCPPNSALSENGQCYCNFPQSYYLDSESRCACSPGYVFASDGATCIDPYNTSGGVDGIGAGFMDDSIHELSMCDGVICPEGQSCVATVFGALCR